MKGESRWFINEEQACRKELAYKKRIDQVNSFIHRSSYIKDTVIKLVQRCVITIDESIKRLHNIKKLRRMFNENKHN